MFLIARNLFVLWLNNSNVDLDIAVKVYRLGSEKPVIQQIDNVIIQKLKPFYLDLETKIMSDEEAPKPRYSETSD